MGDLETLEQIVVVAQQGHAVRDAARGATSATTRSSRPPTARCPAEPMDAEHPLYILYTSGSTAKPKGILHTTGGYLTGVSRDPPLRLRPARGERRLLVRGRRRLGHRPLLHRLRPALQRRDVGDVGGRARLPAQGHLVGDRRALRRDDPLLRADRDPRVHQVGRAVAARARPELAAAARLGRRADQPEGVALVPQGDRRRALPDRRHLVADRDRRDHDHAAARDHRDQAGLGDARRSRACSPRCVDESHRRADRGGPGPARAHAGRGRRCCARSTRRTSASSRPTSGASAARPTSSATPRAATRTATSG